VQTTERARLPRKERPVTASPDDDTLARAMSAGADACLGKPFLRGELMDAAQMLLADSHRRERLSPKGASAQQDTTSLKFPSLRDGHLLYFQGDREEGM